MKKILAIIIMPAVVSAAMLVGCTSERGSHFIWLAASFPFIRSVLKCVLIAMAAVQIDCLPFCVVGVIRMRRIGTAFPNLAANVTER